MILPRHGASASHNAKRLLRSRLLYVLAAIAAIVALLQLSGWSRARAATASTRQQQLHHAGAGGPDAPLKAASSTAAAAAAAAAGGANTQGGSAAAAGAAGPTTPAAALGSPPYRLPRLIHQTVANKSRLSCEEKAAIESWKTLNPGYTHRLWDDAEMREFVAKYYPELVPVPYDELLSGTERSDIWRVLVLHKYGGVYADMDVLCLKPIDDWNKEHGHDAALLVGLENYDAKRKPYRLHVNNWALAAMPGHPLLARMPGVVTRAIARQFFDLARSEEALTRPKYEQGILARTGPAALTAAVYEHLNSLGFDLNRRTERDVSSRRGVAFGSVRVLPVPALSTGWRVAEARAAGRKYDCAQAARDEPTALVCHMFWGSWRSKWKHREQRTYDNC